MKPSRLIVSLAVILAAFVCVDAMAADVGSVIALRGHAVIDRDNKESQAKIKDGILLSDSVSTLEASRAKMLFIDDSVLTMGENSKVKVKEFLYGKDKTGKTVLNLIEGKMKTVVGRAGFEVHTPTAIAAARGTVIYFDTSKHINGKECTTIMPSEGTVIAKSTSKKITGSITLTKDLYATICEGEPLPKPQRISAHDRETLVADTDILGHDEISLPGPGGNETVTGAKVGTPGVIQQPVPGSTPPGPPPPPPPPPPPATTPPPSDFKILNPTVPVRSPGITTGGGR